MSVEKRRRKEFDHFYSHAYGRHIVLAMVVGIGALLTTALLDRFFQPERAASIWQARLYSLTPMVLLTLLTALGAFKRSRQLVVMLFTLIGCAAVLEFARRSLPPYHHYYNNAVVLIVMFCFVLTRIQFRWGLLCAVLLFVLCNVYWLGVAPDPMDLLVIKNFVILVTCVFSLMAAWTLEKAMRENFYNQQTLEQERDELLRLQKTQQRQGWLSDRLGEFQVRISGDHEPEALFSIALAFLCESRKVGFGAALQCSGNELLLRARYALPEDRFDSGSFTLGEGLVGEAARHTELMVIDQVPDDYARIASGTGDMRPLQLLFCPVRYQRECRGVIELAMLQPANDTELQLLRGIGERLGHALVVAEARNPDSDQATSANGEDADRQGAN